MVNQSWSELVRTGLVTGKNWKRLVYTGPVRFFGSLGVSRTSLGLGPKLLRLKTETGLDFQTLILFGLRRKREMSVFSGL